MKILYDHLIFSLQKYGGVSKYFAELLKNIPEENWTLPLLFSDNEYLESAKLYKQTDLIPFWNNTKKGRIMLEVSKPYTILKSCVNKFDVYHQTHFDDFLFPFVKNKKVVTTFHDINFSTHTPDTFFWRDIVQKQELSMKVSDKIIAISHNTKKDILKTFKNIDENKIEVIHHGVDKKLENLPLKKLVEEPYILYVGTRNAHKNWNNCIRAFAIIAKKNKDINLVCTWRDFSNSEKGLINSLGLSNRVVFVNANETAMAQLYRDAQMFVYPSFYEGFGMPILEAMVYDCPVVLSDASCFPEIAGDAGVYFDPYNIEDIAEKMLTLLDDTNFKNKQIELSKKRLELFSWEKCAQEHLNLYKSLL